MWVKRLLQVSQLGQLSLSSFRGEGPVWLIGAVVCLLAVAAGPLARAMDGRICAAAPLALADQLPLPRL